MNWSLEVRRLDIAVDTETAFAELFAGRGHSFWLDSSLVEPGLSRFSFLGDSSGPDGEVLSYRVGSGVVESSGNGSRGVTLIRGSIFDVLETRLSERAIDPRPELPFVFDCGYVGYLGYELKADCGSLSSHASPLPDAVLIAATRLLVVDHLEEGAWLLALHSGSAKSVGAAEFWLEEACARLSALAEIGVGYEPFAESESTVERSATHSEPFDASFDLDDASFDPEPWLLRSRASYIADIERCKELLRAGESYQVCLTNLLDMPFDGDPFALYLSQRRCNPAPYAAYLQVADAHVLCSSPERFLEVRRDRAIESRPIKGTCARSGDAFIDAALREELRADPKNRAENVTIVDLVRNDLGRVCEPGSVCVPSLMTVESYATVHQIVSTVRGKLRPDVSAVSAVRACFPGGSMTGAPKLRTMEIIDALEGRARGVYSGAIGYFGLSGGADLNIVIRTMVVDRGRLTVGAGGAITVDSDPLQELEEMLLKARAPLRALRPQAPEALLSQGRI